MRALSAEKIIRQFEHDLESEKRISVEMMCGSDIVV